MRCDGERHPKKCLGRSQQREAVIALTANRLSERQACKIVGIHRSTYRRPSQRRREDAPVIAALHQLALHPYRRGFPWMLKRLRKEGFLDNHKRLERIYGEQRLQLPKKQARKRYRGPLVARPRATALHEVWCADFMSDSTRIGRQGRIFNLLDEWSRYSIDLYCAASISGSRVVEILERAIRYRGASPQTLVVDNGPEFLCKAMERWAQDRKIRIHFIQKGRPTQNCFVESFNSILRREYLNKNWFSNVAEMAQGVLSYRDYYNQEREHSSLGWQTPTEFETNRLLPASPPAPQTTTGHAIPVL